MKKVDFNRNFVRLDGSDYLEHGSVMKINQVVANNLITIQGGEADKIYDWAKKLYKGEVLELNKYDFNYLKRIIEGFKDMFVIVKAQILECMEVEH